MKAFGVTKYGSVDQLQEFDLPVPGASGRNIVVKILAVSINPVDTKARSNFGGPEEELPQPRVLGYDASGVVHAVGEEASLFKVGDEVFFAGSLPLNGTHAQFTVVDERIVGRKPTSLSHEDAAALPLTMLTALEGLFEGAGVPMRAGPDAPAAAGAERTLLVIGGAGGVGSSLVQVAKHMSAVPLRVIATASRPETKAWCERLGADLVVNHHNLKADLAAAGVEGVDYVFNTNDTAAYFDFAMEILKPTGALILINGVNEPVNIGGGMFKRIRIVWELMFTRPLFSTEQEKQNALLNAVAAFVDAGKLVTTRNTDVVPLTLDSLKAAHTRQSSGKVIGKQVLSVAH